LVLHLWSHFCGGHFPGIHALVGVCQAAAAAVAVVVVVVVVEGAAAAMAHTPKYFSDQGNGDVCWMTRVCWAQENSSRTHIQRYFWPHESHGSAEPALEM